jgi:glutathione reductase (NADPH)
VSGGAFDYDLFVIGGGSGGVRAARVASEAGARVALAEEYRMGGTCVIRGCVPKKLMMYASQFSDHFENAAGYGWSVGAARFDWGRFVAAKDAEISRLEAVYRGVLVRAGVEMFPCRAEIRDPHTVELATGPHLTAKQILVATGGRPWKPAVPGVEHAITSDDIFHLTEQPKRMLIVGGGYVACEFAGIMNGLGTHVRQFYRGDQILRGFDDDLRDHVADAMRARGIAIEVRRDVAAIERHDGALRVTADNGEVVVVDAVLMATGRRPHTHGLGLERAGIELGPTGAVPVDRWSQTPIPSIYAVGDVTERVELTPAAIREGQAFARTVFGGTATPVDHALVPSAVFTQPEAASVGPSEAEARAQGEIRVYRARFRPMLHILAGRPETMLIKLIVRASDHTVLACHIVGQGAAEIIQMAAIAIGMGATKEDFDRTLAVHPTAAEELVTMREPVS